MTEAQNITRVRSALFDTLDRLTDKENAMPIDRAKAVCDVAQVLINTAKVEIEHMKLVKGKTTGTGFLASPATAPASPKRTTFPATPETNPDNNKPDDPIITKIPADTSVTRTVTQIAPGATVTRNVLR